MKCQAGADGFGVTPTWSMSVATGERSCSRLHSAQFNIDS